MPRTTVPLQHSTTIPFVHSVAEEQLGTPGSQEQLGGGTRHLLYRKDDVEKKKNREA